MKELLAVILVISSVVGEAPYAPSGWKPNGPAFALPEKSTPQQPNYLPSLDPRTPRFPSDIDADVSVQGLPAQEQVPQFQLSPVSGLQYIGPAVQADVKTLDDRFRLAQFQAQQQQFREIERQRQLFSSQVPSSTTPQSPVLAGMTPRPIEPKGTSKTDLRSTTESLNEGEINLEDSQPAQNASVEITKQNIQEYPPELFLNPLAQIRFVSTPNGQFGRLVIQTIPELGQKQAAGFNGPVHLAALQSILAQKSQEQNQQLVNAGFLTPGQNSGSMQYQLQRVIIQPVAAAQHNQFAQPENQENLKPVVKDVENDSDDDDDENQSKSVPQPQFVGQQPQFVIAQPQNYQPQQVQYQIQSQLTQQQLAQPQLYAQPQVEYQPQLADQPQLNYQTQTQIQPQDVQQFQLTYQPQQKFVQQNYQPQDIQPQPPQLAFQQQQYVPQQNYQPQVQIQSQDVQLQQPQLAYQPQQQFVQQNYQPQEIQPQQPQLAFQQQQNVPQQNYQPQVQIHSQDVQLQQPQLAYQPQQQFVQQHYQPQEIQPQQPQLAFQQQQYVPQQNYQPQPQSQSQDVQQPQLAYQPQQQLAPGNQPQQPQLTFQPQQQFVQQNYQSEFAQPHLQQQLYLSALNQDQQQYFANVQQSYQQGQSALQSGINNDEGDNGIEKEQVDDNEEQNDQNDGSAASAVATAFGNRTRPRVYTRYGAPAPAPAPVPSVSTTTESDVEEVTTEDPSTIAQATAIASAGRRKNSKFRALRNRPVFTVDRSGHLVLAQGTSL